jgi:excisionase family DNA binding protein
LSCAIEKDEFPVNGNAQGQIEKPASHSKNPAACAGGQRSYNFISFLNSPMSLESSFEPYLTREEVAAILHISPRTVRRLIESKQLRSVKLGKLVRITPDDLRIYQRGLDRASIDVAENVAGHCIPLKDRPARLPLKVVVKSGGD